MADDTLAQNASRIAPETHDLDVSLTSAACAAEMRSELSSANEEHRQNITNQERRRRRGGDVGGAHGQCDDTTTKEYDVNQEQTIHKADNPKAQSFDFAAASSTIDNPSSSIPHRVHCPREQAHQEPTQSAESAFVSHNASSCKKRGPHEMDDVTSSNQSVSKKRPYVAVCDSDESSSSSVTCTNADESAGTFHAVLENDDIAEIIFSYLDVKALHKVSMTRKSFANIIRHDHVVRTTTFQGGNVKKSLERMLALCEKRSIVTPSPLRLLRVLNGKRCERCNHRRVNLVSSEFGLFLCQGFCLTRCSKHVADNGKWGPYIRNPRVATQKAFVRNRYGYLILLDAFKEKPSMDRCGPLITMNREIANISHFLQEYDSVDTHAEHIPCMLETYKNCKNQAEKLIEDEKTRKSQASKTANDKRVEKARTMVAMLSQEIGEHELKEKALASKMERGFNSTKLLLKFKWSVTQDLMKDFVNAPSKATKKKIKEVASTLRGYLDSIQEHAILSFGFLSVEHPLQMAVKMNLTRRYPPESSFYDIPLSCWEGMLGGNGHANGWLQALNRCVDFGATFARLIVESSSAPVDVSEMTTTSLGIDLASSLFEIAGAPNKESTAGDARLARRRGECNVVTWEDLEERVDTATQLFPALFDFFSLSFFGDDTIHAAIVTSLKERNIVQRAISSLTQTMVDRIVGANGDPHSLFVGLHMLVDDSFSPSGRFAVRKNSFHGKNWLETCGGDAIVSATDIAISDPLVKSAQSLATRLFSMKWLVTRDGATMEGVIDCVQSCLAEFSALYKTGVEFMQDPQTVVWKDSLPPSWMSRDEHWPSRLWADHFEYLQDRKFHELRQAADPNARKYDFPNRW